MYALHVGKAKIREIASFFLSHRDQSTRHVVRIAEWEVQFTHQPVRQIGRSREAGRSSRAQIVFHRGHGFDHARHRSNRQHEVVRRVKDLLFVFLHVLRVGQRKAFHHGHQGNVRTKDTSDFRADQLCSVRVFLLRHDRRTCGPLVRHRHETELSGGPDHQFFGETGQVHCADRRRREEFQRKVTIRCRIEAVRRRTIKPQRLCRHMAINRETCASKCRSAQRAFVHPLARIGETRTVTVQHFDIGQHMMAPCHWLRDLKVGKARHDPISASFGLTEQGFHQRLNGTINRVTLVTNPKAEIDSNLIVTAAGCVQTACRLAYDFFQTRFDVHVNIFERFRKREVSAFDL